MSAPIIIETQPKKAIALKRANEAKQRPTIAGAREVPSSFFWRLTRQSTKAAMAGRTAWGPATKRSTQDRTPMMSPRMPSVDPEGVVSAEALVVCGVGERGRQPEE